MKICIATNWGMKKLIEGLAELNQEFHDRNARVYEVFGALKTSIVGGGRPSVILPDVTWSQAKEHVELVHSAGMKFNYLINAQCMGNREFYPKYHRELLDYLDKIADLGVDSVTVGMPYLLEIVRDQYPDIGITVSTFSHIDSVRKAMFFEELGADRLILANDVRRNFELIKNIRRNVKCDIEILANNKCIHHCPLSTYHMNTSSHGSQTTNIEYGGHFIQYPMFRCEISRLFDPAEFIKSTWIRPEDAPRYMRYGIGFIKVEGRHQPTWWLLRSAKAYLSHRYDGNLFDLVDPGVLGYLQHSPLNTKALDTLEINIDNRALDGFLDFFEAGKCTDDCTTCDYCNDVAKKVVHFDRELAEKYIESANKLLKHMTTSKFMEDFETEHESWRGHSILMTEG